MINHSVIVSGFFLYYYGFVRHVHRRSKMIKYKLYYIKLYTRLIIYYGKAVKILVEHFIFFIIQIDHRRYDINVRLIVETHIYISYTDVLLSLM